MAAAPINSSESHSTPSMSKITPWMFGWIFMGETISFLRSGRKRISFPCDRSLGYPFGMTRKQKTLWAGLGTTAILLAILVAAVVVPEFISCTPIEPPANYPIAVRPRKGGLDVTFFVASDTHFGYKGMSRDNRKQIDAMRKETLLVNVGRSALVDTDALARRLEKGEVRAMLDVFDIEPLPKNSPLRKMKNAYLTPHAAGATRESLQAVLNMLIDDLEAHLTQKKRKHAITQKDFHCLTD